MKWTVEMDVVRVQCEWRMAVVEVALVEHGQSAGGDVEYNRAW